ncbi:GRAM domain-containing protein [Limibacter armeniacum]|uniref:GRAM domain-containing protein n=1 Tax=Limibacter armeniacum TaxID=466084 RepID=UPI002FE60347
MEGKAKNVNRLFGFIMAFGLVVLAFIHFKWSAETVVLSIVTGIVFFMIPALYWFLTRSSKSLGIIDKSFLQFGENILIEGEAGYLLNDGKITGNLYLTESRLVFKTSDSMQVAFTLNDIAKVRLYRPNYLFSKGIIITVNRRDKRFMVEYPNDWRVIISSLKNVT